MQAKIGSQLLSKLKPEAKPYEVYDTELKGFTVRVQPSGFVSYLLRYYRPDGTQSRVGIGRHPVFTPAQARDEARKLLGDVARGQDPYAVREEARRAAKAHTLKSFLDEEYETWVLANQKVGRGTIQRLRACFAEFLDKKLGEINPWLIDKWRSARLKEGRAPATVNRDLDDVRALLAKAVEWGMLEVHPLAKKVKRIKVDNERVRFLSEDEESRLRAALDAREEAMREERDNANRWRQARGYPEFSSLRDVTFVDHLKPMVLVSMNTGLRQGELFQLEWQSVDLPRAILTVKAHTAKSSKTRHLPLNEEAFAVLKTWRAQYPDAVRLVFSNREGVRFDNVQSSWEKLLVDAGIVDFHWHDLRHHFASWLVMTGVDLNTVRELLGHADIKMTLRYAHLAPEHKAAAVARLMRPKPRQGPSQCVGRKRAKNLFA